MSVMSKYDSTTVDDFDLANIRDSLRDSSQPLDLQPRDGILSLFGDRRESR